jgi:hypothetical protein
MPPEPGDTRAGDNAFDRADRNARPRATPTRQGIRVSEHFRVRRDRVDADGKLTIRHNSRLHHIGMGRRWSGTKVLILARDLELRVITHDDGELIRELTLSVRPSPAVSMLVGVGRGCQMAQI